MSNVKKENMPENVQNPLNPTKNTKLAEKPSKYNPRLCARNFLICRLLQIKICSIFPPSRSFSNLFFYFFLSLIDFLLDFFGLFSPPFKFSFIFVSPFFLCTLLAACEVWIASYVQSSHDLSN